MDFGVPATNDMIARGNGSIWPGIQNLLLAARALELGAAPTTLALTDRKAVAEALNLPESMAAYALIPVGYPLGNFDLSRANRLMKFYASINGHKRHNVSKPPAEAKPDTALWLPGRSC